MPPYSTLLQAEFAAFHPAAEPKLCGGLVSVALVRALRRTGVTRCLAPRSPDFPRRPRKGDAAVRPSRRIGSLARRHLYDEPVEGGGNPPGKSRRKILEVKVVIKVREQRAARRYRPNQLQRLIHRLVRWVRQVAQRRDDQQVEVTEEIARCTRNRADIGEVGESPTSPTMRWALAMHDRNGLERTASDGDLRIRSDKLKGGNPGAGGCAPIHGVLPALAQFIRSGLACPNRQNGILRVGIGAQLINAASVVDMDVRNQRAIQSPHAVAQRLLTQVHPWIDDHSPLRDAVQPFNEHRAAQPMIALVSREANAATTSDTRNTTARAGAKHGDARCRSRYLFRTTSACCCSGSDVLWSTRNPCGAAAKGAVKRLICQRVGLSVLFARYMARAPVRKTRQPFERIIAKRSELRVAHSPSPLQLLYHELAIKKQVDLPRSEFGRKVNRRYDSPPLCNVVRRRADRSRDRSDRYGVRLVRSRKCGVVQCNTN
jgi:hypothetical protein